MNCRVKEQRKLTRYLFQILAEFSGDGISGQGTVVNLSTGGCGIEGIELVGGTYLSLLVVFLEKQSPIIIDLATVRWAANGQAGFEFLWMRPTQQARMQKVLPY